jgi:hypothetical protein
MHPAAVTTTPGSIASGPYEPRHMLVNHVALGLYYAVVHLAVGAAAGALDPRTVPARRSDRLCKGSAERTQEFPLHTRCTPTVAAGQRPRGRRIQICSELYIPMEASPRHGKTAFSAGAPGTDAAGGRPLTRRPITCQFTAQHRVYSPFMRSAKRPRFTLMEDASPKGTIIALPRLNEWSPDGCGSPHLAVLSRDGCWSPLSTPCWVTVANTEAASRWVSSRCQAPCSEGVAARAVKQFHSTLRGEPQIRLGAAPIPDNIARSIHRPRAASRSEAQWEPYD